MLKQSVKVERPAKAAGRASRLISEGFGSGTDPAVFGKKKGTPPVGYPAGWGTGRNSRMRTVASALGPA
jgi:hypothetical protein